jgi:hypothetical protein
MSAERGKKRQSLQRIEMERFAGDIAGSSFAIVLFFPANSGKQIRLPFFLPKETCLWVSCERRSIEFW